MSKDGAENGYDSFQVPPDVEQAWLAELVAERLDSLGAEGNWRVISFLKHHGLVRYVESALAVEPRGEQSGTGPSETEPA